MPGIDFQVPRQRLRNGRVASRAGGGLENVHGNPAAPGDFRDRDPPLVAVGRRPREVAHGVGDEVPDGPLRRVRGRVVPQRAGGADDPSGGNVHEDLEAAEVVVELPESVVGGRVPPHEVVVDRHAGIPLGHPVDRIGPAAHPQARGAVVERHLEVPFDVDQAGVRGREGLGEWEAPVGLGAGGHRHRRAVDRERRDDHAVGVVRDVHAADRVLPEEILVEPHSDGVEEVAARVVHHDGFAPCHHGGRGVEGGVDDVVDPQLPVVGAGAAVGAAGAVRVGRGERIRDGDAPLDPAFLQRGIPGRRPMRETPAGEDHSGGHQPPRSKAAADALHPPGSRFATTFPDSRS